MSRILKLVSVGSLALGAVLFGSGAALAGASPSKAPSSTSGTFVCTTGQTGTFVVNSGHSTATAWDSAHLTFSTGRRGIFVPFRLQLTFTAPTGSTFTETVVKGNGHYSNTCHISETSPTGSLSGTVFGKIVANG